MDHLAKGLKDTTEALDSIGVVRFGAGANLSEVTAPLRLEEISVFGLATTLPQGSEADPVLKQSFSYPLPRTMQLMIVRADVEDGELRVEPIPVIVEDGYPRMHSAKEGAGHPTQRPEDARPASADDGFHLT